MVNAMPSLKSAKHKVISAYTLTRPHKNNTHAAESLSLSLSLSLILILYIPVNIFSVMSGRVYLY